MSSNKSADEPYVPEIGDLAWKVIMFLKANSGEELTAIDIGVKFDVDTDLVAEKLRRATVHKYLRRSTNRQNAHVWKLGARPAPRMQSAPSDVALAQADAAPPGQRYVNRVSVLPAINRNTPLVDEETRKRNEIDAWLKGFNAGDSVTFPPGESIVEDVKKNVARFRKDHPDYYFGFVQIGSGQWGMERRSGPPKTGRKKGDALPVAKKKAAKP